VIRKAAFCVLKYPCADGDYRNSKITIYKTIKFVELTPQADLSGFLPTKSTNNGNIGYKHR